MKYTSGLIFTLYETSEIYENNAVMFYTCY